MDLIVKDYSNPFFIGDMDDFKAQAFEDISKEVIAAYKECRNEQKGIPKDLDVMEKVYLEDIHNLTHIVAMYHFHNGREDEYLRLKTCGPEIEDMRFFCNDVIDIREILDIHHLTYRVNAPLFEVEEIMNPVYQPLFEE